LYDSYYAYFNQVQKLKNLLVTNIYNFAFNVVQIHQTQMPVIKIPRSYFFAKKLPQFVNKKLSCRKETVQLLRGSVLAKRNWDTIFCGHYRSIFNHCNKIGLQSYGIRWITDTNRF